MPQNGGSPAIRGFVYQFLHTLMTLLDHCPAARIRSVDVPKWLDDQPTEMLFQLEGREDLAVQNPSNLHLFQLKDHKDLAPAKFAEDVLLRFARQYVRFKAASPEFVLYTSARLDGKAFFQPFRALCSELREASCLLDVTSWSFNSDLSASPISSRKAKVWASERSEDDQQRPIRRRLPKTDSVNEFLSWLRECLFIREAGITSTAELTDFLSRVSVDDGNAHENLRQDVLRRLEDRLPTGILGKRLDRAIGKLISWAADKAGEWVGGHQLLQELGIPQGELSWGAVQAGCNERVLETHPLDRAGDEPYEERTEALAYFRLWLELPEERPMFIVSSNGRTGKSRLLRKFAHYAADRAPVVLVKSGQSPQGIVDELLRMAGWEGDGRDWTLKAALERLNKQPSRPDGHPSLIVLVDDFSGSEEHSDWVEGVRSLVTGSGGLLLLATQQAALRMVPESTWQEWTPMVWRPPTSSKMLADTPLAPSYELPYPAEQEKGSLTAVEKSVAGKCQRAPKEIKETLNHIASLACVSQSSIASVSSDQLADLDIPCWDWRSTNPLRLPQALVDAGLFRRSGEALVLVHCIPAVGLVVQSIREMTGEKQQELSASLASMWSPPHPTVFQGFVDWLGSVSGAGVDDEGLLGLLRPWTIGHLHEWTPYVFEMVGDAALEPLRAIAEELVEDMPGESDQRHRHGPPVRGVLSRMKATGSPQLAQTVLDWFSQTGNAWLKRELLAFFSLESGEEGLDALLDQLRQLPGGGSTAVSDLTAEQVRVVCAIARKGAEAVPKILERLDPDQSDCIPLMVALGQIGTRQAVPRLEGIAAEYEAATPVGHYARKALALCEGEVAPNFAREALESSEQDVVELGFWMVTHDRLCDLHPEIAGASRRLAEAEQLQGTAFLEAATIARSSATDHSWRDLLHACRRVLSSNHTIWLYRPMIRSGLPDACQLLLEFVIRVWQEYRRPVNGTTYALWALAEEAVSSDQVAKVDKWLQDTGVQESLAEALMALSAKDGFGHALQVAAKVRAGSLQDMMSEGLGSDRSHLQVADLACMVPHSASVGDLAAITPDWNANRGIALRCAKALAAHGSPAAFDALAEVLRSWEFLTEDVGTAFASAAVSLGRVPECREWLADSSEAKCLRQACALAVGHALGQAPDSSDSGDTIAALAGVLGEGGDVANAAAMAANMSRHPKLLPSLKWLVDNCEPAAVEALFAIAAIGTRPAFQFLYETYARHPISHLSGAPTEALAKALGMHFRYSADRNGPDWDTANQWLVETYKRFVQEPSSGDIGEDVVVAHTLLDLALDWDIEALSGTVEADSRADTSRTWYSSSDAHLRWRLLARHRPGCLIELARKHIAELLSESNKSEMARALLEVVAPEYQEDVRDLVLAIVQQSKMIARRQIARYAAELEPSWLKEIEVCEAHGPFLRDVAVLSSADTSQAIVNRLLDAATRAIRRYGYEAQHARERQEQAIAAYSEFRDDECPFHRLWWVNSFMAHADEVALTQLYETCTSPRDLARQFALREMEEQVGKRLKKEAEAEDRSIEGGFRPWIW